MTHTLVIAKKVKITKTEIMLLKSQVWPFGLREAIQFIDRDVEIIRMAWNVLYATPINNHKKNRH